MNRWGDKLDEKSSNEDIERFLANYFLEQREEESKEEAAARQRAEQLVGRD